MLRRTPDCTKITVATNASWVHDARAQPHQTLTNKNLSRMETPMLGISNWAASAFVLSIAMLIPRGAEAERSNGDVIVEWNQLLQANITGLPIGQPRSYAMLHVATTDAVIAVRGRYQPFHAHVRAPEDASAEAAAAQAGHDGLVALFPAAQAAADATPANRPAPISPEGLALGL